MTPTLSRSLKAIVIVGAILSLSGCLNLLNTVVQYHSAAITNGDEKLRSDNELAAALITSTGASLSNAEKQQLIDEIGAMNPDQKIKIDATMRTLAGDPVYNPSTQSEVAIDFSDPNMKEAQNYYNEYFRVPDGSNGLLFIQQLMATSL